MSDLSNPMVEPIAVDDGNHSTKNADAATDWLKVGELARIARVSERRVHQAVRDGELRAAVVDRRGTLRIHRRLGHSWLERLADRRPDFKAAADGEHEESGD
jgi:hypothetical protein